MISYRLIREGIARRIMGAFPAVIIDDEDGRHLDGPAFLVRLADTMQDLDDDQCVHRVLAFNVVYLAPLGSSKEAIYEAGFRLAAALQPTIAFADREIPVYDLETRLVDADFQVDFTLDFFDRLQEGEEKIDYMQVLEFRMALSKKE
ncbi:MAG: hypothetical protein KIB49_01690 [Clostridiales bacterium]|nr:hypothetical protein [Clostridiales bacterium]